MPLNNTPLWLEIKTEYIDTNIDKVISYLARESSSASKDSFYSETEKLLSRRVEELIDSLSSRTLAGDDTPPDEVQDILNVRILGTYLLVFGKREEARVKDAFFYMLYSLMRLVADSNVEDLVQVALKVVSCEEILKLGFGWQDIRYLQPEVLAHKLPRGISLINDSGVEWVYEGKGCMMLKGGILDIFCQNILNAQSVKRQRNLSVFDGAVSVMSDAADRIRQAEEDDLEVMENFTRNFIHEQERAVASKITRLKEYEVGEMLPVRYLGRDRLGNLLVETVEEDHVKIAGQINYSEQIFRNIYPRAEKMCDYLEPGDVFEAQFQGGMRNYFSLEAPFLEALTHDIVEPGTVLTGQLRNVNDHGLMLWWTSDGYPAYIAESDCEDIFTIGDYAELKVISVTPVGYVYVDVIAPSDETFNEEETRRYCLSHLIYEKDAVFDSKSKVNIIPQSVIHGLVRMLFFSHRTVSNISEQYRYLCVARIAAVMCGRYDDERYLRLVCRYLADLLCFVTDRLDKMVSIAPDGVEEDCPGLRKRAMIIDILRAYGDNEDSEFLSSVINSPASDDRMRRLASLIQSSNRIDSIYPGIRNVIKREITRFLSLETEDNIDLEEASGLNLGVENSRQEFKTSFFFAPADAREQNQEKTIFKTLCGFLNTAEGGSLYLGVNDGGSVAGLDNDIMHLDRNVTGAYYGLDGYVRYITDRARDYFDTDVRVNFNIEPAYDNNVVVIRVEPYTHGVVTFEGVPYVRNNSETVRMSNKLRRQMESKKYVSTRKEGANIVALKEAISEGKQVIINGYASSSSDSVSNRVIEPFCFVSDKTYVWAFDKATRENKLFRVSRMRNVQITDESWTDKLNHAKGNADIFHFTGPSAMKIVIRLDITAHNLILEEYPESAADMVKEDDNHWILTTDVYNIIGIGRFYVGLADHIEIISGDQLKNYAREYFRKHSSNV